jgi:hypothetical protein
VETEARSRYSVQQSREEIARERLSRWVLWGLAVAAFVVILVFGTLLLMGAGI